MAAGGSVGSIFSYMKVYCPICKAEMNGMNGYGRMANCCDKNCYDEWEWRKTLAICGKPYKSRITEEEKEKMEFKDIVKVLHDID